MQPWGTLKIYSKEDFERMNKLLLDGKRYQIEKKYRRIACHKCLEQSGGICSYCRENSLQEQAGWIYKLSDRDVEKIYDEVKGK